MSARDAILARVKRNIQTESSDDERKTAIRRPLHAKVQPNLGRLMDRFGA